MLESEMNFSKPSKLKNGASENQTHPESTGDVKRIAASPLKPKVVSVGWRSNNDADAPHMGMSAGFNELSVGEASIISFENDSQKTHSELTLEIAKIHRDLKGISESVAFTEAFLSVNLIKKIKEMVVEELAFAQKAAARQRASSRRLWWALAFNAGLIGVLVVEMQNHFLSSIVSEFLLQVRPQTSALWAWISNIPLPF